MFLKAVKLNPNIVRWVVVGIGGIVIVVLVLCWITAGRIISPERKKLERWHHDLLQSPDEHGMIVQPVQLCGAGIPCLVVAPDRQAGAGERGAKVRQQVTAGLPEFGEVIAHVVLLHGRNGRKEDLLPVAERFSAAGFLCVMPDLPGHGESPIQTTGFGAGAGEDTFASDLLDDLEVAWDLPQRPRVLWGVSMGGAFAVSNARRDNRWSGLIVVSSFDDFGALLRGKLPWNCLVSRFARARGGVELSTVRPVDWAAEIPTPLLMFHGDRDSLIPLSAGIRLFDGFASTDKTWLTVDGADHSNVLITAAPTYAEMLDWMLRRMAD